MRLVLTSTLLLLAMPAGLCRANDQVVTLKLLPAAEIGPNTTAANGPGGEPAIEVVGGTTTSTTALGICDNPAISSHEYVVRGRVKYMGVEGDGYLELLNDFGRKGIYFSRSLDNGGPMRKLTGTSDWREFELPFFAEPGMKPRRLTLNVTLPGAGTVTVAQPLVVESLSSSGYALGASGVWWNASHGAWIGVGLAALVGILWGLVALSFAGGRYSRPVTAGLCVFGLVLCCAALIGGLVALSFNQPWYVDCPLLLPGVMGIAAFGFNLRNAARQFHADELRRMTAADVV